MLSIFVVIASLSMVQVNITPCDALALLRFVPRDQVIVSLFSQTLRCWFYGAWR